MGGENDSRVWAAPQLQGPALCGAAVVVLASGFAGVAWNVDGFVVLWFFVSLVTPLVVVPVVLGGLRRNDVVVPRLLLAAAAASSVVVSVTAQVSINAVVTGIVHGRDVLLNLSWVLALGVWLLGASAATLGAAHPRRLRAACSLWTVIQAGVLVAVVVMIEKSPTP